MFGGGKQERRPLCCEGVRAETIPVSGLQVVCHSGAEGKWDQRRQQLRKGCLYPGEDVEKPPYRTVPE